MKIHLVVYSNNEPYNTTKSLNIESIHRHSQYNIIVHDYDLERIKGCPWFDKIAQLPMTNRQGKRDGYYNAWKAFITKEVYDKMDEGDILYYVDSSRYYICGFTESIDRLCSIVVGIDIVAGSVGYDVKNNSYNCCDNIEVWDRVMPNHDNAQYLDLPHVLNSWFMMKKCPKVDPFVEDWAIYSAYHDELLPDPLASYHHTGDQSIFNILVVRYNFPVFYSPEILHDTNKDKNCVLRVINSNNNPIQYFGVLRPVV